MMRFKPGAAIVLPSGVEAEYICSGSIGNFIMKFTAISPENLHLMAQFYERSLGDEFREAVRSAIEKR